MPTETVRRRPSDSNATWSIDSGKSPGSIPEPLSSGGTTSSETWGRPLAQQPERPIDEAPVVPYPLGILDGPRQQPISLSWLHKWSYELPPYAGNSN